MPTPTQVANRAQPPRPDRHYTATVTAVTGSTCTVALDPGGATTSATPTGPVPAVGARVLVLVTTMGNFVLGQLPVTI